MKEELELKLQNDFIFMYRDMTKSKNERGYNTYQKYGCECSGGWYQIIHKLSEEISDRYAVENKAVDIEVQQIKEKWGSLRFYYSYPDNPNFLQAFDSMDGMGVRFYPSSKDEAKKDIQQDIAEIVGKYEKLSKTVCENCGQPGELRLDMGRKQTLCDLCYDEHMIKMKEWEEKRKIQKDGINKSGFRQ